MGLSRNFHTKTIPRRQHAAKGAPLVAARQNSASSTTGPKAAPKPAQAKETMRKPNCPVEGDKDGDHGNNDHRHAGTTMLALTTA